MATGAEMTGSVRDDRILTELYHKDVVCYFQDRAWADLEFSRWWAINVWNEDVSWSEPKLLLADNLEGQT
eukprot:SAG31_NODE_32592_length_353_cov_24.027559_1_plen_69_part_01